MVQIAPPPPSVDISPKYWKAPAGYSFLRLFNPTNQSQKAQTFRFFGPLKRFDHQVLISNKPALSSDRGILYAGSTISGCIVEIFGDTRIVEVGTWEITQLKTSRDLHLLDLRGAGAMKAGTVAAVCKDSDHSLSQKWSKFFYENHYTYQKIDGLIFNNAHNDETAFALYERCSDALISNGNCQLRDEALRGAVLKAAADYRLTVIPY